MNKNNPRSLDINKGSINMTHGAGGRASAQLIRDVFIKHFNNPALCRGDDGAVLPALAPDECLVMSCDAHVVSPLFFPGGDIGSLAVNGTINDVAVMGAKPLYLAAAFIIEEGFALSKLDSIVRSMSQAASQAGVCIVTGDTKVVERGKGDGIFITTTGVGVRKTSIDLSGSNARPKDKILVSGSIGDHGIAILCQRENLMLQTDILSDCAALHELAAIAIEMAPPPQLRLLRDPTRGGLATTLNEISLQSKVGMMLDEKLIPLSAQVAAVCELLGLDPLYVANEGKLVAICAPQAAEKLLAAWQSHPLGQQAAIIGEVNDDPHGFVQMQSQLGGKRIVDWLSADQLPRIC